jgi:hypothetical protein
MTASQQNELTLIVYAPAVSMNDSRPLSVVREMERALPGLRLEWTISKEGIPVPLPQRDAWISQGRADGPGFPLLCNGSDENGIITVYGLEIPAGRSPGGNPLFDVHATLPLSTENENIAAAMDVLEAIAEGSHAFWGHATPFSAGVDIARQTKNWALNPSPPPRGLPALNLSWTLPSPEIPHRLGWLNYWSAEAARAIGFPDPSRDADLLSRARRTATGGWIVQLTDAPLELDNPAHLAALLRTYERFPKIGGRSAS